MPCSSDPDTVDFVQTIEDCFYIQHVLSPTRGDAVLDLVLSTDPDLVSNVNVIDQLGNSDHVMLPKGDLVQTLVSFMLRNQLKSRAR